VSSQSPPAGTIVPGYSAVVTVTVTDLCGNASHCVVHVAGQDKTGPVVTCPASMTVTNCTVPCVPVTATDNCCPQGSLRITQSPPCGTQIGPGINTITVTVTDCNGNSTTKVVHLVITGPQSFLANLFNTGVNSTHALLADDVVDTHYLLPASAVPAGMPSDYHNNSVAVSPICHSSGGVGCAWLNTYVSFLCYVYTPWDLTSPLSKWIAPDYTNNGCCPAGGYTYTLNFTLPPSLNPATASISGRWAADNQALMYLNGNLIPVGSTFGFSAWTPFTIPAGSGFNPTANTLKFIVTNLQSFTGLRVEFTNAFANCSTCAPPVMRFPVGQAWPLGSTATFSVNPGGTPPMSYQWYDNNVPLAGANSSSLSIHPVTFSSAGLYSVVISNPCGVVTDYFQLYVTMPLPWPNGWWNVAVPASPLAAAVGPDLNLVGSSFATNYSITAGTTDDLGLPSPGGDIVNAMHVTPLPPDTSIQVPPIAPPGSNSVNSYTVIMDLYEPDTSFGTSSTLFQSVVCCLGSGGQDGVALTLDGTNNLHITGSSGGVPFDAVSTAPLPVDAWNRLALVVDNPQDGAPASLSAYLNGQILIPYIPCPCCLLPLSGTAINWSKGPPTLLSVQSNAVSPNAEFYVSSIQFHAIAMTPQMIAGLGSPDNGPTSANNTSVGPQPVLSATLSNGVVNLTWPSSPYVLQETTDLTSGIWVDSTLSFTESQVGSGVVINAVANPATEGPSKFYRLIFRP
jgi:hypothetical protein